MVQPCKSQPRSARTLPSGIPRDRNFSSPAGNDHTTDVPGATWNTDGRHGAAYGPPDSSAYLTRFYPANQSDLDFEPRADPFTISVWVRTTNAGGYNTILGKDGEPPSWPVQYRLWTTGTPNSVQAINGAQYGPTLDASAHALNNGQWHLLTMTSYLDGATWRTRVYYDDGTSFVQFDTGPGGRLPCPTSCASVIRASAATAGKANSTTSASIAAP